MVAIPLGILALASAAALMRWPARWAQALVWVLVLQNLVVIAAWKATGSSGLGTNLLYAKEVFIAGGGLLAALLAWRAARAGQLSIVLWLAVAFGVVCAVWVPISYHRHEPVEQIARGLRSLVYPVLLLAIGALAVTGLRAILAVRSALWWSAIVLGASAVVERTFVPLSFWISIGLEQYWVGVRGEAASMLNGALPWNFYLPLFGSVVRRAFGIMTDPLDLSYFLLLPLGLAAVETWRLRSAEGRWGTLPIAAMVASAAGIAFSLSRIPILTAGVLIAVAPALAIGLSAERRRSVAGWAVASIAGFGGVLLASALTSPKVNGAASIAASAPINQGSGGAHLATLLRLHDLAPLLIGHGLGTAGYLSAKYASSGLTIGYEDPYLDAAAQVGILGGLLLAAVFTVACVQLLRARGEAASIALATGVTLSAVVAGGLISGQLEVVTSLGATCLFAGMMLNARAPIAVPVEEPTEAAEPAAPQPAPVGA